MNVVYVITGSAGEYDDYCHWVERVYQNKEDAERYVAVQMIEWNERKNSTLTEEENEEYEKLWETETGKWTESMSERYRFLNQKRYDSEAKIFNGYHIQAYEVH